MEKVIEVEFKFQDGYYTLRPQGVGDSVCGATAHAIMYDLDRRMIIAFEQKVAYISQIIKTQNS